MSIAGNPFENAWTHHEFQGDLRIDTGTYSPFDVDIALPTKGLPWVVGRTFNAGQKNSGGSNINSNGYQGKNWFQTSQPEIVLFTGATHDLDVLYLVYGADRYIEFQRTGVSYNQFKAKNGAAGGFDYQAGSPDLWVLTDQIGNQFTFFGFNTTSHVCDGQFWKMADPDGNVAYVGHATTASTAMSSGFDGAGRITTAYDAADHRFSYVYSTLNSVVRLTQVKAETKDSGSWGGSPVNVRTAVQVDYTYYGNETHGDIGDLKQVKITTLLNDSGGETDQQIKRKHYRYWEGSADDTANYNSSTNPGYPHAIKYVIDYEGVRVYDWLDSTFDEDHLTANDSDLDSYAAAYLEYDSSHRVNKAWFNGQCGCSGNSTGTHLYTYETNGSYSDNSGYDQTWCKRTVTKRPDTSYVTQYFDELGQGLAQVLTDIDPTTSSPTPKKWVTRVIRDANGCVTSVHTPENTTGYTHNTTGNPDGTITSSTTVGLVRTWLRTASSTLTGFATDWKHQKGWNVGTPPSSYFDGSQAFTTISKTITNVTVYRPLVSSRTVYSQEITSGSSGAYTTSYSYNDYSGSSQPLSIETSTQTNPAVSTGNNGSNSATTIDRHYQKDSLVDFQKNEDATIDYFEYSNGQVSKHIQDADTALTSSGQDFYGVTVPSSPIDFHKDSGITPLHWKTTTTYTSQGFQLIESPPSSSNMTYRSRLADHRMVVLQYGDYDSGTPTYYGPVRFTVTNQAGREEASGIVALSSNSTTSGQDNHIDETKSDPIQALALGTVAQMRTSVFSNTGTQVNEARTYFSVPGSGAGTEGTHYDSVRHAYDDSGREIRVKDATGTIRRTVFDLRNNITDMSVGLNDHGLSGGESSGTSDMLTSESREFDSTNDGLNNNLTKIKGYKDGSNHDDKSGTFDYRGRRIVDVPPAAPYVVHKFDNMGREIATGYYSSSSGLSDSTDPTSTSSNRLSLSETYFDEMGRVWKSVRHKITQSNGADADTLLTLNWYDARGRAVKVDGSTLTKTKYDRLGRVTDEFVLAKDDDAAYTDVVGSHNVVDVSGDIVLEQHETRYDTSVGTVLLQATISRFHTDFNTGETTGPLDTNADGGTPDDLKLTAADVKGRVQITAKWYDSFERPTDQVEYGTYGASPFDRNGLSVPARSDTALRTSWAYNTDGTIDTITDPRALVTKRTYDAEGRLTKEVKNYDAGVNSGNPNGTDQNVTVSYGYTNGLRTSLTAVMHSGGDNQVTTYIYGTTKGTPSQMQIGTGNLLRAIKYPDTTNTGTTVANIDSDSSDVVSFAYDAQGREVYKKDQAGNVTETDYDGNGRATQKRVTTVASGFDNAVVRIATTYDSLGRTQLVTQYDNATVGSGSVVDEVKYDYDDWGNVLDFRQDHNSAVDAGGSVDDYSVTYAWTKATTGRNTLRRTSETLPSSKVITYNYRSRNGLHDDEASRVTDLTDGGTTLVTYDYNGAGQVVGQKYPEPNVQWKEYTTTVGDYADLDRFNRVVKSKWTKNLGSPVDFYHVELTYDRNSNITSADDQVHSGFDVVYTMDNVDRLTEAKEGTLSSGSITSTTRDEQWTLSHTGNWDRNKVDLNGDGDFVDTGEVDDTRVHDKVNQLNTRDTDSNSSVNYTLAYDGDGSLTDDNKDYKYVYDAFNRLRKVNNQSNALVAEYRYNGLGYKIAVHADTDSDGDVDSNDKWYYDAFDDQWRAVARFRESDTSPKEEFVYHAAGNDGRGRSSYIDLVVLRNKDANTAWTSASDGTLEERIYYCQNWRADISALVSSSGTMKEWVKYSAYGIPFGLPGGDTDSDGDCDTTDVNQVQTWINGSTYDVRGDIDLDGDVDATDKSTIQGGFSGISMGRGVLTGNGIANRMAWSGTQFDATVSKDHIRRRVFDPTLGRWLTRDKEEYIDGVNLVSYTGSRPVVWRDPSGEAGHSIGGDDPPVNPPVFPLYVATNDNKCAGECSGLRVDVDVSDCDCTWKLGVPLLPDWWIEEQASSSSNMDIKVCPSVHTGVFRHCACKDKHDDGPPDVTDQDKSLPVKIEGLTVATCKCHIKTTAQDWKGTCRMVGWF